MLSSHFHLRPVAWRLKAYLFGSIESVRERQRMLMCGNRSDDTRLIQHRLKQPI